MTKLEFVKDALVKIEEHGRMTALTKIYDEHAHQLTEKDNLIKELVEALQCVDTTLSSDDTQFIQYLPEGESIYKDNGLIKKVKEAIQKATKGN